MKKTIKSVIALTLSFIMLIGTLAAGGSGIADVLDVKASASFTYSVGDIISYGTYPQSAVTDTDLVTALNNAGGIWVSYRYHIEDVASDYMRYKDVVYNGCKYRAVTFDSYRPTDTSYSSSADSSVQDDNGYTTGNVYWFKYEPLKWCVLDPATGLVVCNSIIDSQPYNIGYYYYEKISYGDSSRTYYSNSFAESNIRNWLNNDFYNTAFTSDQQAGILTTVNDNTSTSRNNYSSSSDKVYLLSQSDAANSSYGFSSDESRIKTGTDYAKSQGLLNSTWLLRTPFSNTDYTYGVFRDGKITGSCYVNLTDDGIVPAMNLETLTSDTSYPEAAVANGDGTHTAYDSSLNATGTESCTYTSSSTATCTEAGTVTYTCTLCGYSYSEEDPAPGHTPAEAVKENVKPATCTEGSYDSVVYCSACKTELSRETVTTDKVTDHTPAEPVKENVKPATCTEEGSYDSVVYCSACKTELSRTHVAVPATGHNDRDKNGICNICGRNCIKVTINTAPATTVDYKSEVIIKATATGVPNNCYLAIYNGDFPVASGTSEEVTWEAGYVTHNISYTVKVIDDQLNVVKDSEGNELTAKGGVITCKTGFLQKVIAFFRTIFKTLPTVTVKPA